MGIQIDDRDILAARRDLSVHGVGLVLLANGLLLALFWLLCWRALGGTLSARPEALPALAIDGYALLAFACIGYILVMDLETAAEEGAAAARRITMDWMWWGLLPVAAFIAASAAALDLGLPEPRRLAVLQGALSAALILYGLSLTRFHFHGHLPP